MGLFNFSWLGLGGEKSPEVHGLAEAVKQLTKALKPLNEKLKPYGLSVAFEKKADRKPDDPIYLLIHKNGTPADKDYSIAELAPHSILKIDGTLKEGVLKEFARQVNRNLKRDYRDTPIQLETPAMNPVNNPVLEATETPYAPPSQG